MLATAIAAQTPDASAGDSEKTDARAAAIPLWIAPPDSVNAGYFSLGWNAGDTHGAGDPKLRFEIQEDTNAEFTAPRIVYRGPETATTLSGKANGTYYYRVRIANAISSEQAWSATHAVVVTHHPLSRAFAFLILGAIVFLSTAVLILRGNATENQSDEDTKSGAAN